MFFLLLYLLRENITVLSKNSRRFRKINDVNLIFFHNLQLAKNVFTCYIIQIFFEQGAWHGNDTFF